jgi:hypothetical protein
MATGVPCVAVDPSVGAKEIIGETVSKWLNDREREYYFLNMGILDAVKSPWFEQCDTVILCETIEHIPKTEFNEAWKLIKEQLSKDNGLFIVTNWVDYMPLKPNNKWEHVRLIDDRLYDELSSDAGEVVVREGSHLVLRF